VLADEVYLKLAYVPRRATGPPFWHFWHVEPDVESVSYDGSSGSGLSSPNAVHPISPNSFNLWPAGFFDVP